LASREGWALVWEWLRWRLFRDGCGRFRGRGGFWNGGLVDVVHRHIEIGWMYSNTITKKPARDDSDRSLRFLILFRNGQAHVLGCSFHLAHGGFDGVAVQVRHFLFGDLTHLGACDLADFVLQWLC